MIVRRRNGRDPALVADSSFRARRIAKNVGIVRVRHADAHDKPKGALSPRRTSHLVKTFQERSAMRRRELEVALERFLFVCRARPDVRAVYTFGSFAASKTGPRSDLDLLVVRETTVRGIERGADLAIEADIGVALDLIVVTPYEYNEKLPTTSFGRTILSSARSVYAA